MQRRYNYNIPWETAAVLLRRWRWWLVVVESGGAEEDEFASTGKAQNVEW